MELSTKKLYRTKEGRPFIFTKRDETNEGLLDIPWPYCFQALDTGGEIWCSRSGMSFLFKEVEELEENGIQ